MACILMSCLSAHTLRAVPLISRASVVQNMLGTELIGVHITGAIAYVIRNIGNVLAYFRSVEWIAQAVVHFNTGGP